MLTCGTVRSSRNADRLKFTVAAGTRAVRSPTGLSSARPLNPDSRSTSTPMRRSNAGVSTGTTLPWGSFTNCIWRVNCSFWFM
ncbi:hypothetical protein D3C87_2114120 [compost metagenome]